MSYIVSWSGGKDSCFALHKAVLEGYKVSYLLNFISKEYKRVSFHGTKAELIQLQAEAIDIPLIQKETTPNGYEKEFKEAVKSILSKGVKGMIFGDIYLEEHRDWVEMVCKELKIKAVEPLWKKKQEKILLDFIEAGFKAIVVSARADLFDKEWIGKKVDTKFLEYLKRNGIDICGENGEYHTLVIDGPLFKKKIKISEERSILRDNFWFLETIRYSLQDKNL